MARSTTTLLGDLDTDPDGNQDRVSRLRVKLWKAQWHLRDAGSAPRPLPGPPHPDPAPSPAPGRPEPRPPAREPDPVLPASPPPGVPTPIPGAPAFGRVVQGSGLGGKLQLD